MLEGLDPAVINFAIFFLPFLLPTFAVGLVLLLTAPRIKRPKLKEFCEQMGDWCVWYGPIILMSGVVYIQWGREVSIVVGFALFGVREGYLSWITCRRCGRKLTPHAICSAVIAVGMLLLAYAFAETYFMPSGNATTLLLALIFLTAFFVRPFASRTRAVHLNLRKPSARTVTRTAIWGGLVLAIYPIAAAAFRLPYMRIENQMFIMGVVLLLGGLLYRIATRLKRAKAPASVNMEEGASVSAPLMVAASQEVVLEEPVVPVGPRPEVRGP